ncbi:hypothetical protein BO70DRAFT_366481 [Aspergillus heteromorphus CBS 117.55]|uniref:Uncharacterized protein n=1 Tax=Aspergillus heteromorphus CBS 117.55 TaxID=1448321 RepID=A0A317V2K2_9EURO|nr:uncharacterized protein BO70DRAFT_366481 [Aspergillus heteromorphus CBS 117.55]PWY66420.1 hypothetical protein BO70DRAFT_366481 [Aspergillus heteromorphus CBS 117.55]
MNHDGLSTGVDLGFISFNTVTYLIQNIRGISHYGAWTGFGLHEDGFTSWRPAHLRQANPILSTVVIPESNQGIHPSCQS